MFMLFLLQSFRAKKINTILADEVIKYYEEHA